MSLLVIPEPPEKRALFYAELQQELCGDFRLMGSCDYIEMCGDCLYSRDNLEAYIKWHEEG